ncbi:hypothetical protein [Streptomyces sp. cg2]|uniref:hypothetical protein n=1 Tax=Streptomyces sp. cg2 TaxID=3238799 RepID=UPI0034E1F2AB
MFVGFVGFIVIGWGAGWILGAVIGGIRGLDAPRGSLLADRSLVRMSDQKVKVRSRSWNDTGRVCVRSDRRSVVLAIGLARKAAAPTPGGSALPGSFPPNSSPGECAGSPTPSTAISSTGHGTRERRRTP